jgi:hypothetical protein
MGNQQSLTANPEPAVSPLQCAPESFGQFGTLFLPTFEFVGIWLPWSFTIVANHDYPTGNQGKASIFLLEESDPILLPT